MRDFIDIGYLKTGNERQRKVYELLTAHRVLEILSNYDPIVVGTIPINIDLYTSDVDIICYVSSQAEKQFIGMLINEFSQFDNFKVRNTELPVVACFVIDGVEFEIFAEDKPTAEQNAYRHMQVEDYYLRRQGSQFRAEIIRLKDSGLKTEPAFAELLGLDGDPYLALLREWERIYSAKL